MQSRLSVFTKASNTTSFEKHTLTPGQLIRRSQARYSDFLSTSFPVLLLKNSPNVSWLVNSKPRDRRAEFLKVESLSGLDTRSYHRKFLCHTSFADRAGQTPLPHSGNPGESLSYLSWEASIVLLSRPAQQGSKGCLARFRSPANSAPVHKIIGQSN